LAQLPLYDGISLLKTSKERYYNNEIGATYIVGKANILIRNAYKKWSGVLHSLEQMVSRARSMRHMNKDHIMHTMRITTVKLNLYSDAYDTAKNVLNNPIVRRAVLLSHK
jgi:hypothetical protein